MTLEDLISNLKNDTLDLEIKICSLCDFYFDSGSYQKNAKIIANAHDDNQINLISLATQVIEELNKNELINRPLAKVVIASSSVVFKKLCHFLKLLKTGMMHYGNYI